MNPQGTSFIPQRPAQGKIKKRGVRKIYILTYVSYVLFFGTLILSAALFFYTVTLDTQLSSQHEQLIIEESKFSSVDIDSIRELENRISIAKDRMNQHISVLSIFEALERDAVQSLNFTGFSYVRTHDLAPLVTLTGKTEKFDAVLFQREVLASNPILSGGSFGETSLSSVTEGEREDVEKMITFVFEKSVDVAEVGYAPRVGVREDTTETAEYVDVADEIDVTFEAAGGDTTGEVTGDNQ